MTRGLCDPDDDDWAPDKFDPVAPPELTVEVTDPAVLGYLYGPRGEVLCTLLDRPVVPFGFRSRFEVER